MDAIKAARELGRAIQEDERFKAYTLAKEKNDNDDELQYTIGDFNLIRQNLQMEMSKPEEEKKPEKIDELNKSMQDTYQQIMSNPNMAEFTIMKNAVDKMLGEINQIISLCCDGEDPDTCEPAASGCGSAGGCSGCSGCG